jgi:hypothetical protein
MKALMNIIAIIAGFGLELLIVVYSSAWIEYFDPSIHEEQLAIVTKAIGAFIGSFIIVLLAKTKHIHLALIFGLGLVISEILFLFLSGEATFFFIVFKFVYLLIAYLSGSMALALRERFSSPRSSNA